VVPGPAPVADGTTVPAKADGRSPSVASEERSGGCSTILEWRAHVPGDGSTDDHRLLRAVDRDELPAEDVVDGRAGSGLVTSHPAG
jgi:hypothetical protein